MTTKKRKVLLIGWDGADWEHINPLLDEGALPNLEKLINGGTMANLATLQPVLSPMLWNSVATGKFADKHGIHGFIEPDPADEARPLLEGLLEESPWEDRFIIQLADCYFQSGYYQQAVKLIDAAYDFSSTGHTQAIIIYAKCQLRLGELKKGLALLKVATKRSRRYPLLHAQIGDVLTKLRRWDDAESSYRNAIQLHPELAQAHEGLAHVHVRQSNYDAAIDSALDAVGLVHRLPKAHLSLGIALTHTGDVARAIVAFRNAAKFTPRATAPHRWLAYLYRLEGNNALADRHALRMADLSHAAQSRRAEDQTRANQLFKIPAIADEAASHQQLINERPSPHDEVEKSGKTFVIVSGLPRSGTSLMMQMLVAGGMEPLTDGKREADRDNPRGYFEWEDIKRIAAEPELLDPDEHDGKVIKTISMLLSKLPKKHDYKVIFMMRPVKEIAASQQKMIDRLGTDGANIDDQQLTRELATHRAESLSWLKSAKHVDFITVSYPDLIADPNGPIAEVVNFLGDEFLSTPEEIASAIDTTLYRNRQQTTASVLQ